MINLNNTILIIALLVPALISLSVVIWNVLAWPKIRIKDRVFPRAVSVLIPARNEEENLAACLDAVLLQGETVAEVLVYDDHSTDATPDIVRKYEERDKRVRLIAADKLPPGWCGKNFACAQLAKAACGQWLLFLDSDARLNTSAVASLIEEARLRELTFLSGWPGIELVSFWERMLMPMLNFVVLTLFPAHLSLIRNDSSLGLAHGACILVDRESYFDIGGHAAVCNEIFEDRRLAQLWRSKGKRGLCLDGQAMVRVRMYKSFREIWSGFQKNFFPAFQHYLSFWIFLLFHLITFLIPLLIITWIHNWPVIISFASILLMRLLLVIRFNHPLKSVLFHPIAEAVLIAIGLSSWWRCKSGKGVEWKGRRYYSGVEQV